MKLTSRAYAKVNLALAVGPARPPKGYHPIVSWFACVDLSDEIELERPAVAKESVYTIEWAADAAPRRSPIDWPLEKDLGVRAHRLMEELARGGGRDGGLPVRMRVTKRIPVGGGLGGGSADAAAAMLGVNGLYGLDVPLDTLRRASARLGSDVAFFLDEHVPARPAVVGGFGEQVERVAPVAGRLVLIFPPFGCATAGVYAAFDQGTDAAHAETFNDAPRRVRSLVDEARQCGLAGVVDRLWNDLAAPACAVEPRLREMLGALRSAGLAAQVTGSGSTMFVVVQKGDELSRVQDVLGEHAAAVEVGLV